jgi:ABC transporter with metal-binding/Fe-S-binding domain ATP-binding protein
MTDGGWISLFSGGKDSSWAVYRALDSGRDVTKLVTVHPPADSYLYHVPATDLASLAAESIGIPLMEVEAEDAGGAVESGQRGDEELAPLQQALEELVSSDGYEGITAGAVESRFQRDRLQGMADRLGLELYAPLWQRAPIELLEQMVAGGFEIVVIAVAADGLDEDWLGRVLDRDAIEALARLRETHGVHPMGEGGEFETLVTDGPHMDRPIIVEGDSTWDGTRGELRIDSARLG